jgi:hypothetical protein
MDWLLTRHVYNNNLKFFAEVSIVALVYFAAILSSTLAMILLLKKLDKWLIRPIAHPYMKRHCFYRPHEKKFLGFLVLAVGHDYLIMSKASLADILTVRPEVKSKIKPTALKRLQNQKVDYVLCNRKTAEIICTIDLYDPSHKDLGYFNHSVARGALFHSVGLPWVRIPIQDTYQVPSIKKRIFGTIEETQTRQANRPNQNIRPAENAAA